MQGTAIKGINKASLWQSWKAVRSQLKRAPRRDVLDYLEYDVDPDVWISRLLVRIKNEDYSPESPVYCSIAKSRGFDRVITMPIVPDVVLYRTIVDHVYRRAAKREVKHAYFSQATLSKVVSAAASDAQFAIHSAKADEGAGYPTTAPSVFLEWLRYDQYRKLLIFERIYPFIVITDISNFFDSVLYSKLQESLFDLGVPSRMASLLFHMLEAFALKESMSPSHGIGLPVDPCDCSRVLAHVLLFSHDRRMVAASDEGRYVRWMDDQNIGVESLAEGLEVLGVVCSSLRRLHLTPNASKSKVLSLKEARIHFHFEANADLDRIFSMPYASVKERKAIRGEITLAWERALKNEGLGEWDKVLKRFYRICAIARSRKLVQRSQQDILKSPSACERVISYLSYVCEPSEIVDTIGTLLAHEEQIYPDIGYQLGKV